MQGILASHRARDLSCGIKSRTCRILYQDYLPDFIAILAENQGALLDSLPPKVRQKDAMSLARCKCSGARLQGQVCLTKIIRFSHNASNPATRTKCWPYKRAPQYQLYFIGRWIRGERVFRLTYNVILRDDFPGDRRTKCTFSASFEDLSKSE